MKFEIYKGNLTIYGETLEDAVRRNLNKLKWVSQKSTIEAEVTEVSIRYEAGILGGKGGAEVKIHKMVQNYTNRPAEPEVATLWIYVKKEDCPEDVSWQVDTKRLMAAGEKG